MHKLAAIVGPTAVGKTDISLQVAQLLGAEILSCDSMQVYKHMDIGTAKASIDEQNLVKHHLIDIVTPDVDYTVADYQTEAKNIIEELNNNKVLPILVGGTGLYYQAVVDNYTFYPMETKKEIRQKWTQIIDEKGLDFAYQYLQSVDKEYASIISQNDQKRIIRAIEVYEITGQPFSSFQKRDTNTYKLASVGLYMERHELYERINKRVHHMIDNGLIDEVLMLRKNGYDITLKSMQSLGYLQVCYYLDGFLTREEMIYEIQKETRRFAKRQFTWFNKDKRIAWFEVNEKTNRAKLAEKISLYMEGQLFGM